MSNSLVDVLIVDSNRECSDKLCSMLERVEYSTRACAPSNEATMLLEDLRPLLLVVSANVELDTVFGLSECALKLGAPVVFYGEGVQAETVVAAMRAGASDFALDPFDDTDEFVRIVSHAIEQKFEGNRRATAELRTHLKALEADQNAGKLVQRKLMPDTPVELAGIQIAYTILPSLYLSGDAIDFGLFGKRYVAFYLLDVSGHSAASAFVAVWVKQMVRGFFKGLGSRSEQKPLNTHIPELMSHINGQLIDSEIGQHLTAFVGVIDTQTLDFSYVVAGHLPLPLLLSTDSVTEVPGAGKPLGIFADAEWSLTTFKLPDSFSMVICSDGVFELLPKGDLDARERYFKQKISSTCPHSLDQLESLIVSTNAGPLPDDVALLLVSKS